MSNERSLHDEGIPEFARPVCELSRQAPFWVTLSTVNTRLRVAGFASKAQEFLRRAEAIAPQSGPDAQWELCLLALQYVALPESDDEEG